MIYDQPLPPEDALDFLNKILAPSPLTSSEWQDVPAELRARAFFSSQVESAQFLQAARGSLQNFLANNRDEPDADGTPGALKAGSRAAFVDQMQTFLADNGVPRTTGGLTDITSQGRLGLIFNTQVRQANDYGYWKGGMDGDKLNEFPASRFIRVIEVKEPRFNHELYQGKVFLKTDPVWYLKINQDFGVPWGPWGWGCGHDVEDVDRDEAEALSLIEPGVDATAAQQRGPAWKFNTGLVASAKNLDPDLIQKLKDVFGERMVQEGEILRWAGDAAPRVDAEMSDAEASALKNYTDNGFVRINEGLRTAQAGGEVIKEADAISQALATLPDYQGTVYRGVVLDAEDLSDYVPGNVVTEDAFTSASEDRGTASGFGENVIFRIESVAGKNVAPFSEHAHEDEILFDQGTQFKVLSRELVDGVWHIVLQEL